MYSGVEIDENQEIIDHSSSIEPAFFIRSHPFSIEFLKQIPDYSIHLLIVDFTHLLTKKVFESTHIIPLTTIIQQIQRILITGGKVVLIVENCENSGGQEIFFPFHALLNLEMLSAKFIMRGEAIWNTSHLQSHNIFFNQSVPNLQPSYKHILIYSKQVFKRLKAGNTDTITRDQFLQYTKSIWKPQPELMTQINSLYENEKGTIDCYNHLFQLYSFEEDTILCLYPEFIEQNISKLTQSRKKVIMCPMKSDMWKLTNFEGSDKT